MAPPFSCLFSPLSDFFVHFVFYYVSRPNHTVHTQPTLFLPGINDKEMERQLTRYLKP